MADRSGLGKRLLEGEGDEASASASSDSGSAHSIARKRMRTTDEDTVSDDTTEDDDEDSASVEDEHSFRDEVPADSSKGGYSSVAQKMMSAMGYMPGRGLGKLGTGIAQPIEESMHKGRRGLGYLLDGLEREDVKWELEEVVYNNPPTWLEPSNQPPPALSELRTWMKQGKAKETIQDETQFCDPDILQRILNSKTVFDNLSEKEFLDARQRSNPFETIKGAIFQNRAAMKMANIDTAFDFMFSSPKNEKGVKRYGPFDVLYFADICAGPGGFSEYMLWRKKWHAKGFGFTLKDPKSGSDFKLDNFFAAPCETFDPHYGVGGYDGDGDITKTDNLSAFEDYVMELTEGRGVEFVMADGGISVEGQENIQEILTKQLVLCQYVCALSIIRAGGHFICKVFDMFTPFSVGLFYLLYRCFQQVCIYKPATSRPANSERYIICKHRLSGTRDVHDYLFAINQKICDLKANNSPLDILQVVSLEVLRDDEEFLSYVKAYNDSFGVNQCVHLKKLQYFVKNTQLTDKRQAEIRRNCLKLWKVPHDPRSEDAISTTPASVLQDMWKTMHSKCQLKSEVGYDVLESSKFTLVKRSSLQFLEHVHSWKWFWGCGTRLMLVGLGRNRIQAWDMRGGKAVFSIKHDLHGLELPKNTVLEVELALELHGEKYHDQPSDWQKIMQSKVVSRERSKEPDMELSTRVDPCNTHFIKLASLIMDMMRDDVLQTTMATQRTHKTVQKQFTGTWASWRQQLAKKLCQVVNKPCRKTALLMKCKQHYRVADLEEQFSRLSLKVCKEKGRDPVPTFPISGSKDKFFAPIGVIFFKHIKDPWHLHLSTKSGKLYYYNGRTSESSFDCPLSSVASYLTVLQSRHLWQWTKSVFEDFSGTEAVGNTDELTPSHLYTTIQNYMGK